MTRADRFGPRRGVFAAVPRAHARIAGELAGDVDPRRLAARLRVPGVADEYGDLGRGHRRESGLVQQLGTPGKSTAGGPPLARCHSAVEHVRLAAAHLRHERLAPARCSRLARQATQHQAGVLAQRRVKQVREKNCSGFL